MVWARRISRHSFCARLHWVMQGAQKLTKLSIEDQIVGGLPLGNKKRALHFLSMFARYGRLITNFSVLQNSRNCCF